jgi:hypothetical protein
VYIRMHVVCLCVVEKESNFFKMGRWYDLVIFLSIDNNLSILIQNTVIFAQKYKIIGFQEKGRCFGPKVVKVTKNIDHNIDNRTTYMYIGTYLQTKISYSLVITTT